MCTGEREEGNEDVLQRQLLAASLSLLPDLLKFDVQSLSCFSLTFFSSPKSG